MVQGDINPLRDGFDVVGGLLFSDINRVKKHHVMRHYKHFRLQCIYHHWKRPSSEPSTPASDIELARMCKGLRRLSIDMSVTKKFVHELRVGHGMSEALKTNGFGMYKVKDLLNLKGLKVLYLQLRTRLWVPLGVGPMGLQDPRDLDPAREVISSWLIVEFRKRRETVEMRCW